MRLVEVSDPADPRLADYRALTDVALRSRTEPELGLFIAEGALVIERAQRAGYALRSVLLSGKWLGSITVPDEVPVYVAPEELLRELTGFHVHRGALAAVHRRPLPPVEELLSRRRIAVLEDVNTHTNVGAIFRGAAALGIDAILLTPSCADPLYRRSVRVSMGAVFALPYARFADWPADLQLLDRAGFRVLALTPDGALGLDELRLDRETRAALLLGAEGPGLTAAARAHAEGVRIPMTAGMDSLNVAAAAAVAFWVLAH
jgi:tRNA G18 (ribose-2'-O)-methylase SpoU